MVSNLEDKKKKATRQNENIQSYHSVSVSDGGLCYSNRTVIKASISLSYLYTLPQNTQ